MASVVTAQRRRAARPAAATHSATQTNSAVGPEIDDCPWTAT